MKEQIHAAILEALKTLGIEGVSFVVDHPTDKRTRADYFSNVALVVAKELKRSPIDVAMQIQAAIPSSLMQYFDMVEVAPPGFINFHFIRQFYAESLAIAIEDGKRWGSNDSQKDKVVLVEYTSPNLFKPLHVGNLVGNIIGESVARLFELSGAEVKRLNYPSDIGLTVAKAVWGLKQTGGNPDDINALGEAYRFGNEAYESSEATQAEIVMVNQALYAESDPEMVALRARGITTSKQQLDAICERLGTHFDAVVFESEAAPKGIEIVKAHLGKVFEVSDGAIVYKGEKVGLHTRVFLNSKGLPTYEAKDLGNFAKKRALFPNWTTSIIVTGNEQTEYFKVLYATIHELYPEASNRSLEHIPTGFLTLTTGKMSSRKGNVLTGESLLFDMEEAAREKAADTRTDNVDELTEQVAVAALKYQILRQAVGSNIVFDKEKALSFEGDSGPYLQYTYARILSVLEKAAVVGVVPSTDVIYPPISDVELSLYQFDEVIAVALKERAPHKVTGFLTELAGAFNSFYAHEKIADPNDEYAPYKAAIAQAVAITLKNGLWVLGIKAPERM